MKRVVDIVMDLLKELKHTPVVLFLDDDEADRGLATRTLAKVGVQVITCDTVPQAVSILDEKLAINPERPFDLALVDILLVNSPDGTEFIKILKEKAPKVPTVIVTGQPDGARLNAATRLGYFGLIKKPLEELSVRQIFDQHQIPIPTPA